MDTKKEKYYRYILNDMINNTIIHTKGDKPLIEFPYFPDDFYNNMILRDEKLSIFYSDFYSYVEEQYGASGKEVWELYYAYIKRLRNLVNG